MLVNLDQKLLNIEDGQPITTGSIESAFQQAIKSVNDGTTSTLSGFLEIVDKYKGEDVLIGLVFRRALLAQVAKSEEIAPDEAQRRFMVASEMMHGGDYDLKEKDRDIIKSNMMKLFSLMVTGQVMSIINKVDLEKKSGQTSTK